jgi:uncharacterized protein YcfL
MKLPILSIVLLAFLLTGCDSQETKNTQTRQHLASLTCNSNKAGRSKEELQAIQDACFKAGTFHKSSGQQW